MSVKWETAILMGQHNKLQGRSQLRQDLGLSCTDRQNLARTCSWQEKQLGNTFGKTAEIQRYFTNPN